MQFDANLRSHMDDSFSLFDQSIYYPSQLNNLGVNACYHDVSQWTDLTPSSSGMHSPIKSEPEQTRSSNSLPSPRIEQEQPGFKRENMMDKKMAYYESMGLLTTPKSFGMHGCSPNAPIEAISFMMTPTQSLSDSEVPETAETASLWSCADDSPISFFPNKRLSSDFESFDLDKHAKSLGYLLPDPNSSNRMRAQKNDLVHKAQKTTTKPQRTRIRLSGKQNFKPEPEQVDVVPRAMCTCDYLGCHKAFRRIEHLKRHKQTFHDEGPNRFSCEFCGKDQFNRQDNLNNHRKLHARPNSRNRGVEFLPAAVPVIEQEERSRRRRTPSKS
ncbi:hypothetical protein FOPG_17641 [Fusarium oxysporum f. sp. conglutinans race 2 54008]|uniref:C2H2-type domain-containing protein n=1 Tax=Fusarium oxysporum f. sp. conglutinans race 2 54008 TaxID=1089457 RepID=X0HYI2_FUSOX|nr:hypothetical protein FOPG_17641 [Fusarium oxysporum f. sp. conglutinans race 2 54008]KAG6989097.1 C2H2 type master regulator of conidiophore development brlA [Fusarium oxysporum f. sp. conglutinans]